MGFALWATAGIAVFAASRLASPGRPAGRIGEALTAIGAAIAFGIVATVLDFGGWNEPDWRAAAFALAGAAFAVGIGRAARALRTSKTTQ